MSNITSTILNGIRGRRSIHALTNQSTIPDERIEELISEVVKHAPSAFNTQTTRAVVLLKAENEKLWDVAREVASSTVPAELFAKAYDSRIAAFRAAYGTVLFYEDPTPFVGLGEKWPMLKSEFPEWSNVTNGMHQFAAWTLLESEGLGANLQHYNGILQVRASEEWKIPAEWSLKAQLVFGTPAGPPKEKVSEPVEKRLFVHGK
ncbi:hypothetical protein N7492_007503 [Penicillium capsulatum]|uniref:Nitroreductase domain-containing protein n=1 Tax=Penicillium capsulatum TaxID=69766 RepID=A0A9W9I2E8_9EURO|nr:hypothetical protein N7492_007503 [Penicillium capsulatum]KAJ6117337.1 hypothetical protein N7512_007062 [Penicillium capsulatum]